MKDVGEGKVQEIHSQIQIQLMKTRSLEPPPSISRPERLRRFADDFADCWLPRFHPLPALRTVTCTEAVPPEICIKHMHTCTIQMDV